MATKAVILAGGCGTRLSEDTSAKPKPMIEIGEKPGPWHIMNINAIHGIDEFLNSSPLTSPPIERRCTTTGIALLEGASRGHRPVQADGWASQASGQVAATDQTFCFTYGDGVADIDLKALPRFHESHGRLATVTTVRSPALLLIDDIQRTAASLECFRFDCSP